VVRGDKGIEIRRVSAVTWVSGGALMVEAWFSKRF